MSATVLHRFELDDPAHGAVPCAAIVPAGHHTALPVCAFLYGGGGSRESLVEIQPLLDAWWAAGSLPQMVVATPDVGPFSFYLDDPERGLHWERFVAERFLPHVRAAFGGGDARSALVGISMGGYGALKIAFARADQFAAVTAISPMIEPLADAREVPLRNRWHYPPEVPQALLGPERDAALYERDHPASRARRHAAALRRARLAIYVDAAGEDALNAHDGAEHLHRVLWQLDVAHEYRLRRDADHIGPEIIDRLHDAFAWAGRHVTETPQVPLSALELQWRAWLDAPQAAPPSTALPPTSALFPRALRAQLAPLRAQAAQRDATLDRRYGRLPPVA